MARRRPSRPGLLMMMGCLGSSLLGVDAFRPHRLPNEAVPGGHEPSWFARGASRLAAHNPLESTTLGDGGVVPRRDALRKAVAAVGAATAGAPRGSGATAGGDPLLLGGASVYGLRTASSSPPSAHRTTPQELVRGLCRAPRAAVFLGEHHPDERDHELQAALVRALRRSTSRPMAVGLEAVQRAFQPVLDAYCRGSIGEEGLRVGTEWDDRWYWSFGAYLPLLRACRELGVPLLALDASSEDRRLVERGGLPALDPRALGGYVPDQTAFASFAETRAYREYTRYTLEPPYRLEERMRKRRAKDDNEAGISFSNFVARQMLRDEAMATASTAWLSDHPDGLLVGCLGTNHVTFGLGVPGRVARILAAATGKRADSTGAVASILLNPEPINTGTGLRVCRADGTLLLDDDDDEEDPTFARRGLFVPNEANQVCLPNHRGELQNYALRIEYDDDVQRSVLPLADYVVFSPPPRSKESRRNETT